jgi:DNA-binding transcriptional ArsR family regulator
VSPQYSKPPAEHPLDPLLLDPSRLAIVALLSATDWCEFALIRDHVNLSDSALSKQLSTLRTSGYVDVHKGRSGGRPRTWVRCTDTGRGALHAHISSLQAIATAAHEAGDANLADPGLDRVDGPH